jgi:Glycosyltransferase Family 4
VLNSNEIAVLPKLLYVGDVPVESSYHGSALLHRLLQDYPTDRLLVLEPKALESLPERRLTGVAYRHFSSRGRRWLNTRFSRSVGSWLTLSASAGATKLRRLGHGFDPDAVLTVAHGYSWLAAARFATQARLPLHLIVHDDWPSMAPVLPWIRPWLDGQFGRVYRQAASRMCVSPFMEEEYRHRYGVAGTVLYPSRAKDCSSFDRAPRTYGKRTGPLIGAFAGNIFNAGYYRLLLSVAKRLEGRCGQLMLFGPHSSKSLKLWGLDRPNILPQGLLGSRELISRLRNEADFLVVPMTFDADGSESNMRLSFPSKLTDYTATGLPLLICGPEYCSAVRWAQQHSPIAEVVTSELVEEIDAAVLRLESARHRERLGRAVMEVGNRLFSYGASVAILHEALLPGWSGKSQRGVPTGCAASSG